MRISKFILIGSFLLLNACTAFHDKDSGLKIIGETAFIHVNEAKLTYETRIDTGATTTSINAFDLQVTKPEKDKSKNIGKPISFKTKNASGKAKTINTKIASVVKVSNSQGTEYRYVVDLTLKWKDDERKVRVNLRDRTEMTYKLLIGRNWLEDHYLVDVSKKEHGHEQKAPKEEKVPQIQLKIKDYSQALEGEFWDKNENIFYVTNFSTVELDGVKKYRVKLAGQSEPIDLDPSKETSQKTPIALAILTVKEKRYKRKVLLKKDEKVNIDFLIGTDFQEAMKEESK